MSNKRNENRAYAGQSGSNEVLSDKWKDAICPECGKPASGTCVTGWKFFCTPCGGRRWGHPQSNYGEGGPAGLLFESKVKYFVGA